MANKQTLGLDINSDADMVTGQVDRLTCNNNLRHHDLSGRDRPNIGDAAAILTAADKTDAADNEHQNDGDNHMDSDSSNDSECWDDAKALLHKDNDDNGDSNYHCARDDDRDQQSSHPNKVASATTTLDGHSDTVDGSRVSYLTNRSDSSTLQTPHSSNTITAQAATTAFNKNYPKNNRSTSSPTRISSNPAGGDLILHEAVFNNNLQRVLEILSDAQLVKQLELVNKRDKHGNTALHLACMLGRSREMITALLQNEHGFRWSIEAKNLNRWTPFHEACSYGDREIITLMAKQLKDDVDDALHNSKLSDFLSKTKDYRLVLKWEFQSWVPFVSRVLPSDVCVIVKQGKCIRIDTRLLDFEGLFRKKGDSCLVYSNQKWSVVNNRTKKYQHFETPALYKDLEEKVDEFMATDIMDLELKSSDMEVIRSTSGWIWRADKMGKVGRFNAALYDLNNVFLVSRKRREHLSEEDLKRNKSAYRSAVHVFKFGEKPANNNHNHSQHRMASQQQVSSADEKIAPARYGNCKGSGSSSNNNNNSKDNGLLAMAERNYEIGHDEEDNNNNDDDEVDDEEEEISRRESLPPPPPTNVTWHEYLQSDAGNHPTLGREHKCKVVKTAVKASVAMSEEFPLTKREFLDLLSIVPIKMFKKLKEFVEMKLPDGFPVRLDIPVFPFLKARITFEDFAFHDGPVDESLFAVPDDYELDNNLIPGRFRGANTNEPTDGQQQVQQEASV